MRRLGAFVAAGLLAVASLAVPVLTALGSDGGAQRDQAAAAAVDPGDVDEADESSADEEKEADRDRGGPPPWASSVAGGKHHAVGLDAWKRLAPAQREDLMTRLAREHAAGMKSYRACRSDGRADCEKPLPPGLAKRQ